MKIAVVGAGINGLTCAVKIKEKYRDFEVVIISNEFTPNTTGDGSGGLWYPYLTGDTPYNLLDAGQTFTTFISSPPKLLAYLQERFEKANGKLLRAKITSLEDPLLQEYDVVINCTGVQARFIVPDDKVTPYRGQIVKVKAPWVNHVIIDEDGGNYIIPNASTVVLGGTHQHEFNTQIDPKDTDFILNGCQSILPGLKNAEIVNIWVGLRPGRNAIRLEPEERNGKLYIHNYGHGGGGLTLFWGCGKAVLQILETHLNKRKCNVKSKL
ncbi:unnamed protein product [Chrysodeixis includens]|uniref:FAD dependent oxidoreductase domain-containing protein n=1 Tax=Chrysodeixis includens TaxID=689277 RepID=A0A9P0FT75_CHRIL|nr:unnamed protein product [Chrysodeixis includens]